MNDLYNQFVPVGTQAGFSPTSQTDPTEAGAYYETPQNSNPGYPGGEYTPTPVAAPTTPACPICGAGMKLRSTKNDPNKKFYGCERFPECNGTYWINEDGSLKAGGGKAATPSIPQQASVPGAPHQEVAVPNYSGEASSAPTPEELAKRIAAKKLYIYNNNSALQVSVGDYDDKKRQIKKKKIFIEVAPVNPESKNLDNKTYLWGKDKGTKRMISLDYDECVTLMNFLLMKGVVANNLPIFKIYHDPFAKSDKTGRANSAITAEWQNDATSGWSVKFMVSVKKLGEEKGSMFTFKVPRNDILYMKSFCLEVITDELELSDSVVYNLIKDNI